MKCEWLGTILYFFFHDYAQESEEFEYEEQDMKKNAYCAEERICINNQIFNVSPK